MAKAVIKEVPKKRTVHFSMENVSTLRQSQTAMGINIVFQLGELRIHAFKSSKSGPRATFLPSIIEKNGEAVWEFSSERESGVRKIALLLTHEDGFNLIAVVSEDKLLKVIPLDDLEKCHVIKTTTGNQVIGGRSLLEIARLKGEVAASMGLISQLSASESRLMQLRREKVQTGDESRKEKAAERERRRQEILGREKILVYRENGQKILGIPLTSDEWQCLPDGTGVVLVAKYKDGFASEPSEAFFVQKKGSAVKKDRSCKVSATMPKKEKDVAAPIEMSMQLFQFGDVIDEFPLVTGETLEQLRSQKVNCGSQFAVSYKSQDPVLVQLIGNEVKTLGNLKLLS